MAQTEYKPRGCMNCGHPAHCGGAYYLPIRDLGTDDEPYTVKACNQCRCSECEGKAKERDSKGDIPKSMLNGL